MMIICKPEFKDGMLGDWWLDEAEQRCWRDNLIGSVAWNSQEWLCFSLQLQIWPHCDAQSVILNTKTWKMAKLTHYSNPRFCFQSWPLKNFMCESHFSVSVRENHSGWHAIWTFSTKKPLILSPASSLICHFLTLPLKASIVVYLS